MPEVVGVNETDCGVLAELTSAWATVVYSTCQRSDELPSVSCVTLLYLTCCSSRCTRWPSLAAPLGSVTITLTGYATLVCATKSPCRPMSESLGNAVNVLESATERLDASVVSMSTRYAIGYGKSSATLTLRLVDPSAGITPSLCVTSLETDGGCSGQNHWRPNQN